MAPLALVGAVLLSATNLSASPHLQHTPLAQLNFSQVQHVQVGNETHQEQLPTFADMLALIQKHENVASAHLYAELKCHSDTVDSSFDENMPVAVARDVKALLISPDQLSFISFSLGALVAVKRLLPDFCCYLVGGVTNQDEAKVVADQAIAAGLDGVDLNANEDVVTSELVQHVHNKGKKVLVWAFRHPAANDCAEVWSRMRDVGVDFFTSNLPPEYSNFTSQ